MQVLGICSGASAFACSCSVLEDPLALRILRDMHADLFVSIRFGKILDTDVFTDSAPRRPQPSLRSLASVPRCPGDLASLAERRRRDRMHPSLDRQPRHRRGAIWRRHDSGRQEHSLLWHILSVYRPGARLIMDAVRQLERGEPVIGTPQAPSEGAYYSFPTDDDLIRFGALGGGCSIVRMSGSFSSRTDASRCEGSPCERESLFACRRQLLRGEPQTQVELELVVVRLHVQA